MNPYEFKVSLTLAAQEMLGPGQALVLDWHRLSVCCAGESSLYLMKEEDARKRKELVRLEGEDPVYAAQATFPHLTARSG